MTQEEQIRLYRLMEKLNWFFHQEMHYLNRDIAEKSARECYPEIRDFTYDILWNDLPREVQGQLKNWPFVMSAEACFSKAPHR